MHSPIPIAVTITRPWSIFNSFVEVTAAVEDRARVDRIFMRSCEREYYQVIIPMIFAVYAVYYFISTVLMYYYTGRIWISHRKLVDMTHHIFIYILEVVDHVCAEYRTIEPKYCA